MHRHTFRLRQPTRCWVRCDFPFSLPGAGSCGYEALGLVGSVNHNIVSVEAANSAVETTFGLIFAEQFFGVGHPEIRVIAPLK